MNRRKEREEAFLLVYEGVFGNHSDMNEILENAKYSRNQEYCDYAKEIFLGVMENKEKISDVVKNNLEFWNLERVSDVVCASLYFAMYEILFCHDVPFKISINEAIELTKKYGSVEDAAFLNAVLAKVVKQIPDSGEN